VRGRVKAKLRGEQGTGNGERLRGGRSNSSSFCSAPVPCTSGVRGGVFKLRHQGSRVCSLRASSARRSLAPRHGGATNLDAPELVHIARADALRVCRMAELPHATTDAKQIRDEELKTHCLLVASKQSAKKPNHPPGGIFLLRPGRRRSCLLGHGLPRGRAVARER
jgi:hypothetical protein